MTGATKLPPRHGQLRGYPKDADGWPLCRYCLGRCPTRRNTFCSQDCVHEWKIRSDASYARYAVDCRDDGVCAGCGLDTKVIVTELAVLEQDIRAARRAAQPNGLTADWRAAHARLLAYCGTLQALGWDVSSPRMHESRPRRVNLWQADHIHPVEQGGGMAGLDGLQTLCTLCHKRKTAEQARARRKT